MNERRAFEAALGEKLRDDQRVIIQVVSDVAQGELEPSPPEVSKGEELPEWCHVYDGLSDDEIASLETRILDRNGWTRNLS